MSVATEIAKRIIALWPAWEAEAGKQAQATQTPEAYDYEMETRLMVELTDLIEEAAKVCEGRANCRQEQIPIYNEAMKCACQIRHNLVRACGRPGKVSTCHAQVLRNGGSRLHGHEMVLQVWNGVARSECREEMQDMSGNQATVRVLQAERHGRQIEARV